VIAPYDVKKPMQLVVSRYIMKYIKNLGIDFLNHIREGYTIKGYNFYGRGYSVIQGITKN